MEQNSHHTHVKDSERINSQKKVTKTISEAYYILFFLIGLTIAINEPIAISIAIKIAMESLLNEKIKTIKKN